MTDGTENMTDEEKIALQNYLGGVGASGYGAIVEDEKYNVHTFLHRVATSNDTTKVSNLKETELGIPSHPVRVFKNLALISDQILDNPYLKDFFLNEAEIVASTSLSRDAKLIELAVINRRQIEDVTKKKQEPKGFFKKKNKGGDDE